MGKRVLIIFLGIAFMLAGCQSSPKTATGAVAGAAIGGLAGGVIGHQSGHGVAGGLIGAGLGALGGGLIGKQMDDLDAKSTQVNPNHLPITSIVDMASKGVPDDVIISEIQRTKSAYQLTSEVITYLKQNKVSDKVINYMLATGK